MCKYEWYYVTEILYLNPLGGVTGVNPTFQGDL